MLGKNFQFHNVSLSTHAYHTHMHTQRQYTALDDSRVAPLNEENTTDETLKTVLYNICVFIAVFVHIIIRWMN